MVTAMRVLLAGIVVTGAIAFAAYTIYESQQSPVRRRLEPAPTDRQETAPYFDDAGDLIEILPDDSTDQPVSALASVDEQGGGVWPRWRGPGFSNVAATATGLSFAESHVDVRWTCDIPGDGHSTPIVVGDHVYLTMAERRSKSLVLLKVDLETGQIVGEYAIAEVTFPERHENASDAASTPCSDGEQIFVAWADRDETRLAAIDLEGTQRWTRTVGPFSAGWGFAASPVCFDGLVLVSADNPRNGFLAALDGRDGSIRWRRRRPASSEGSYSSPVVIQRASRAEAVIAGLDCIQSFDVESGEKLWECGEFGTVCATTPAFTRGRLVVSSGFRERKLVALDIGPEVHEPSIVWSADRSSEVPYVPSPLCHHDSLYVLHDDGLMMCRRVRDGQLVWKRRIGGNYSASPLMLGDVILCASEGGQCVFVRPENGEIAFETSVNAGVYATPVPLPNGFLVRTTGRQLIRLVAGDSVATP